MHLVVTTDRNILTGSWFCQSLWDLNWTHMQIVVPPDWSPIQASGWVETSQGNLDDRKDHKEMTIVVIREYHPQHVFFPPSCLPSLWMSEACQRTLSSEREPCKPGQKFNWLFMIIHVSISSQIPKLVKQSILSVKCIWLSDSDTIIIFIVTSDLCFRK